MAGKHSDPMVKRTIIVNYCEECKTRYSLEEAQKRNMTCCDKPLKQEEKEVPTPLGV